MSGRRKRLLGLITAAVLLTGCAQTPDQAVVREKGSGGIGQYQEAEANAPENVDEAQEAGEDAPETRMNVQKSGQDAPESGMDSQGNGENVLKDAENFQETETKEPEDGEGSQNASKGSTNALAQKLQVPDRYVASAKEGNFSLDCDAEILVPDVEKVSVWKVSQKEFSQEWIVQVTEAFFGDLPVYNGGTYFVITKDQALEQLNQLKTWQAEGNLDPYGSIAKAEKDGDMLRAEDLSLQSQIDRWEEIYANASEETDRTEVKPMIGASYYLDEKSPDNPEGKLYDTDKFIGAVEMDGAVYRYKLDDGMVDMPMMIDIQQMRGNGADIGRWYKPDAENDGSSDLPVREELLRTAGITQEEAKSLADSYVEKLGLADDFSAKSVELAVCTIQDDMSQTSSFDTAGWQVDYTRDIGGFPVTDEEDMGGNLESIDATTETWCYERIEIIVNAEGLQQAEIINLYDIEEQQVENVQMLSFPEIAGIFEQMLQIRNADLGESETLRSYQIDRVELGYMRVYDPGADSRSGLLVPVWDFFGKLYGEYNYEGESGSFMTVRPQNSFLTVNAADGTVVNRGLGY